MIPGIKLPPKLIPVFLGEARYRGAFGGRGSGKTRAFAKMAAVKGIMLAQHGDSGVIVCGREFMNSLEESSFAEVKQAILSESWLAERYEMGEKYIRTKDKRIVFVFCGLRHNLNSIKSKARIHLMWVDEAEPVSEKAWEIVIPTIREVDSELWVTWNPERKASATDKRFRQDPPEDSKVVEINYNENPFFPKVLEKARLEDLEKRPDSYAWIWEGAYKTYVAGAYYTKQLMAARKEGRICRVNVDPLMTIRAFWDIGGTGAKADACAIWIAQFIGKEIRVLNYYEAVGQELGEHIAWLRGNYSTCQCVLPHDGAQNDKVYRVSYESKLKEAGFNVVVVPNQGAGAASIRVETVRRLFPQMWIDSVRCEGGIEGLSYYHEKIDEKRAIGLGPSHDWASHCADAFGLLAVYYEKAMRPKQPQGNHRPAVKHDPGAGY